MLGRRLTRWNAGEFVFLTAAVVLGPFIACSESAPPAASGGSSSGGLLGTGAAESSGGATSSGGTPGSGGTLPAGTPTWADDVATLVYRECVGCHRTDGAGPFPLETYEQAADTAIVLAAEVEERHMPPMPVDGSGACNTYSNARWLTDEEIELFAAWAEAGAPEGDPSLTPTLPEPPPRLENPTLTLDPGEEYLPNAELTDDYRCFVIDPGLAQNQFVVAYEVEPGEPEVVHHAIVYQPDSDEAAEEAALLDEAETGPGYTCFGGAGVEATPRVLWAPGGGYVELPEGTGVELTAGRRQILQVHYNLSNGSLPDRTTVKLALRAEVPSPAIYQPIADLDMVLQPGLELATTSRTFSALGQSYVVHGVMPHMHTLGRELRVTTTADGGEHCLVSVDRWDFHSQGAWWYSEPLSFDAIDSVSITCGFDTTTRSEPVTWGEGTQDEMCLTYLYLTAPL